MKQLYSAFIALFFSLSTFSQNPVVVENALPGNPISEWGVPNFRDTRIAGFSTKMSLNSGETVRFKISVEAAANYTLKIYRIGYYNGNGARLVQDLGTRSGVAQPPGISDPATGILDCGNWSESASWTIPSTAVSGLYIAKIERAGGGSNHIAFIVRNDASNSDLYLQLPDATWQAYNGYGGNSLYDGTTAGFPNGHAVKVSYNRPFFPYNSLFDTNGRESDWYMNSVYPMIRWLESNGYNVTYTGCNDVDNNGSRLLNHKIFLSVGHDEYWSKDQRANVEAARDAGVHLAFFSGNEVYWKTRWENNDGSEDRTLVCYKEGLLADGSNEERACGSKCDPGSPEWTGLWRTGANYDAGKPENALTGQISWIEFPAEIGVPASYQKLRFWRNTSIASLAAGQTAYLGSNTLGFEWDPEQSQFASTYPTGRITMSSVVANAHTHKLSLYRHSSGALVFGAGTVQWSWGLDGNHAGGTATVSPEMQQATVNLFADMGVQPATLQAGLVAAAKSTDFTAPAVTLLAPPDGITGSVGSSINITGNATDAGGGVVAAVEVSVDGGITWRQAAISGMDQSITWSYSWIPEAEGNINVKVKATDDSGNSSQPGNGITVTIGPDVCPCNIFPPGAGPIKPLDNDKQGIEIGVKFRSTVDGFINGIRYFKGHGTTGTHIGSLWNTAGVRLATATFVNETDEGWQEVLFSSPVAITAGLTYIASAFSPSGDYASTPFYFTSAAVNGPLRGLADGEDGPNGVFAYGSSSAFPTNDFKSVNYWVDVVFTKTNGGVAPSVTTQPQSKAVCSGANVEFTSQATGSPSPTVQWQSGTDGVNWTDIGGATSASLNFTAAAGDDNKFYRAVWTNAEGSVFSQAAKLTVTTLTPPTINVVNNCGSSVLTVNSFSGTLLWSTGESTASITVTQAASYSVTETLNGCTGPTASASANPSKKAVLTSPLTATVKSGDVFTYNPMSSETGAVLTWKRNAVAGISNSSAIGSGSIQETLFNTSNSPVIVTYEYTLSLGACVNKQKVAVTVTPLPGGATGCNSTTVIKNKFNPWRIEKGRFIWFNSSMRTDDFPKKGIKQPVVITVTNATISFKASGTNYSLPVPDARIIYSPDVLIASTRFINNAWETTVPWFFKDDVFMSGLSYAVPNSLPGNLREVEWKADVNIDTKGISLHWEWGAAVYSKFGANADLDVKPVSGWKYNPYLNKDEAGTPENYRFYLTRGATGSKNQKQFTGHRSKDEKIGCGKIDNGHGDDDHGHDDHDDNGHHKPPFGINPKQIVGKGQSGSLIRVDIGPNPTRNYFILSLNSSSNQPVTITVSDNFGKMMEKHERINPFGTIRFGDNLKTGLYLVEVTQGGERKTIKVLKVN